MKTHNKKIILITLLAAMVAGSCKKDFTDPSRATEEKVLASPKGLTGVAVGLQRLYSNSRLSSVYNTITINGFTSNELFLVNPGNLAEAQLNTGGTAVDGTNTVLLALWTTSNKIIYDADNVINNAANLADKNYASGLIAYASLFKALSIGNMSMFWEFVPDGIGENVAFITRMQGYAKAIAVIDNAITTMNANPISAAFTASIPAGIDFVNTFNALKARYYMASGNYTQALAMANLVDLTKKSTFNYDATSLNPLYEICTATNNVFQPIDSTMGLLIPLRPDAADKRVPFYMSINATIAPRFRINGFGAAATTPFPIYLPGEMTLIKAESYARAAVPDLVNALIELNKIVTKTPAADPFGVGADLPLLVGPFTQQQILDQIYKHRSIELYMSGLKLEDMRRFGRPNSEKRRNLFPYPFRERDNNPNTPADPAF